MSILTWWPTWRVLHDALTVLAIWTAASLFFAAGWVAHANREAERRRRYLAGCARTMATSFVTYRVNEHFGPRTLP